MTLPWDTSSDLSASAMRRATQLHPADVTDRQRDARERAVEEYLNTAVRRVGGITFKIAPTTKGLPDRCVLAPHGDIYLVEMKRPGPAGQLSPAQIQWHMRAQRAGHVIHVLRSKTEVDMFVRWIVRESDPKVGKPGRKKRNRAKELAVQEDAFDETEAAMNAALEKELI